VSGDPPPLRVMPPECCPFHASGGHWDSGHSNARVRGHYGDTTPDSTVYSMRAQLEIALLGSAMFERNPDGSIGRHVPRRIAADGQRLTWTPPACEALSVRDPGHGGGK
jgi:hypothetical protein